MIAGSVHKPAQHRRETESHNQGRKLAMSFFALIVSIVALLAICYIFLHQPVKDSMPEHYAQYVHNVKQRYKIGLGLHAVGYFLLKCHVLLRGTSLLLLNNLLYYIFGIM